MAGMWELPLADEPVTRRQPIAHLRHSITTTDYKIVVYPGTGGSTDAEWIPIRKAERMALTGLAKKILRECCEEFRVHSL
jgi:hypothetical protein